MVCHVLGNVYINDEDEEVARVIEQQLDAITILFIRIDGTTYTLETAYEMLEAWLDHGVLRCVYTAKDAGCEYDAWDFPPRKKPVIDEDEYDLATNFGYEDDNDRGWRGEKLY